MINRLLEVGVQCPYCGERFSLLVDGSVDSQEYVEDCEICCRPIDFCIFIDDQERPRIEARRQDA